MKAITLTIAIATLLAAGSADATGNKPKCEYGGTYPKCNPKPEPPKPEPPTPAPVEFVNNVRQDQQQQQQQGQTAHGGAADATGVGIGVGVGGNSSIGDTTANGGAGGHGGHGGAGGLAISEGGAGGAGGSVGNTTSGSLSNATGGAVGDVGNNSGNSTNLLGQNTQIGVDAGVRGSGNATLGDVGSSSSVGNVRSGSSIGDTTLSNGSHSGGNTMTGGDTSIGPVSSGSTSGASIGDQTATLTNGSESASASNSGGNTMTGGANTASNAASADDSGNSNVVVDTSDRSVTNVEGARISTIIPGDLPSNAMTIAPSASITVAGDMACGVLVSKVQIPVYQWDKKGKNKVLVGYDEDVAPYTDANGVQLDYQTVSLPGGGYYLRGSHVTYVLSTQGSANSSQLGLQGGGGGGYGGLSFGSGRSYSQAGARIIIRPCIADRVTPVEPPVLTVAPRG